MIRASRKLSGGKTTVAVRPSCVGMSKTMLWWAMDKGMVRAVLVVVGRRRNQRPWRASWYVMGAGTAWIPARTGAVRRYGFVSAPTNHYNFAHLDEQTTRMIRRAILKAIAFPGYQVPFASREMPMPY